MLPLQCWDCEYVPPHWPFVMGSAESSSDSGALKASLLLTDLSPIAQDLGKKDTQCGSLERLLIRTWLNDRWPVSGHLCSK